ncbi:hypothetical protein [Alteraurantiacibacter buctensis]|uniref:DUF2059 domain-containing protein n=1 Tax=Alteraurantiacibacter buctensis TaxID=1503981 RepID=A0A844YY54_9SPHN|nr:hypothetical protein [Alteraurantiacibacter buctensis]MXO71711.1 hypothetical protein [Alteraurantiacibacter buctensis]
MLFTRLLPMAAGLALAALPAFAMAATARDASASLDPQEMAEARAIIDVMFPPEKREEMMQDMMAEMVSQFAASIRLETIEDAGLRAILENYMANIPEMLRPTVNDHLPNLLGATAVAYVNRFTLAELQDIHAFARTPSGRRYLSSATSLVGDPAVAATNSEYFGQVQELNRQMSGRLRQQVADYLASHPEAAPQFTPQTG